MSLEDQDHQDRLTRWIDRGLYLAATLFVIAVAAVLWSGWHRLPPLPGGKIADITINLNGHPVREHCTTCHPQGSLADGRAHPNIAPHRSDLLGCTACHLGEGMALDPVLSHGLSDHDPRRVLAGGDLQGRCYACHDLAPLPGAERAWAGYRLFGKKGCDLCHSLGDVGAGGYFGPDLGTIGSQLSLRRLRRAIRAPRQGRPVSVMPRFPLSPRQVDALALFLKSRISAPYNSTPMQRRVRQLREAPASPAADATGRELLQQLKCLACHRFGPKDGRIAPDLTHIGAQRPAGFLQAFLRDPDREIPGAIMPLPRMGAASRRAVATFLSTQAASPVRKSAPRALYMELCQRCHAANGDGHGPIQPNLAQFPRPFAGNAPFFRRVSDARLRRSLREGVPGTSMPPYGRLLSEKARAGLLDLLYADFIGIGRHDKAAQQPLPSRPSILPAPRVRATLYGRACARCHGVAGNGWGEDGLGVRPRPRNFTSRPFMTAVDDPRLARAIADGVPGTAMPHFRRRLTGAQIWGLVARIRGFAGRNR